ncbi:MAG: hypothetical protein IJT32_02550, partial [Lachnospiraceae bacterium]|nr:hypothetical protein [Lachnospiraceae bacterium]
MKVSEIASGDWGKIKKYIVPDVAECLARITCTGLVAENEKGEAEGVCIFEWKDKDEDSETWAEFLCFRAETKEAGTLLLEEYAKYANESEVCRSAFELKDLTWTEQEILEASGFSLEEKESRDLYICVKDLKGLKMLVKKKPPAFVSSLENHVGLAFFQGLANCLFHEFKGIVENISMLPLTFYDKELSCCVEADERVVGLFLIHILPSGTLMPVMFACVGPDYQKNLLYMLMFTARAAVEKYDPEDKVLIRRQTPHAKALTEKL